jgi:hypothetical protein
LEEMTLKMKFHLIDKATYLVIESPKTPTRMKMKKKKNLSLEKAMYHLRKNKQRKKNCLKIPIEI